MSLTEIQKEIVEEFQFLPDWEEKYGEIIRLGRKLPEYPDKFRDEKYKVKGCQSQVWLHPEYKDGKIYFDALYCPKSKMCSRWATRKFCHIF